MSKIEKAFALFDDYNRQDPNLMTWDGVVYPTEYFLSLQLYQWINELNPKGSEALQLASRCQHIGRWKIPRNQYPAGKAGYLSWRSDLAKFHANVAEELLAEAGYNNDEIISVQRILLKQNLKRDDEVQAMENALCLVFLQFQYEDFIKKHDEDKVVRILRKTWKKMNKSGRAAASSLTLGKKGQALLLKAVNELGST